MMRVLVAMLAGFAAGVLGFGSLLELVLDWTTGDCPAAGCAGWRTAVFMIVVGAVWIATARLAFVAMERIRPRRAPSVFEERVRDLRRRGR